MTPKDSHRLYRGVGKFVRASRRYANRNGGGILKVSFETHDTSTIKKAFIETHHRLLRDVMVYAYLYTTERTRSFCQQHSGLKLDYKDQLKAVLKANQSINIDKLEELYDTQALRILEHVSDAADEELRKSIARLIQKGASREQAANSLVRKMKSLGYDPVPKGQLASIFETQAALASQAAQWQELQSKEYQEILWGYRYMTQEDTRVRPEHARLHGITLPKDAPFWDTYWPPNGWNCRCFIEPLFEKARVKRPPSSLEKPDEDFRFNPGEVFTFRGRRR